MAQPTPALASVLLVSPSPDEREMYAACFRAARLAVIAAENTHEALKHAAEADVIVLETWLHRRDDGLELIRRLRSKETTRLTPLIVVSACAMDGDRRRAFDAGCDLFLPKPCLPQDLLRSVQQLVSDACQTPPARPSSKRHPAASVRLDHSSRRSR